MQGLIHIMDTTRVREETNSNECRECLTHVLWLQKCLPAVVSLLVGQGLQTDILETRDVSVNETAEDRLESKS